MELLISILLILIVGALIFLAARYIMEALGIPSPFDKIILALLLIVLALWIAQRAGVL